MIDDSMGGQFVAIRTVPCSSVSFHFCVKEEPSAESKRSSETSRDRFEGDNVRRRRGGRLCHGSLNEVVRVFCDDYYSKL